MMVKSNIEIANKSIERAVFLFGAGATRDGGCLISTEMLNDIYQMDLENPEIEAIDFLISSLHYHAEWKNLKEKKEHLKADHNPNIEDLMLLIRRIVNRDSYLPFPITGSWADKINFLEIEWRSTIRYSKMTHKKSLFVNLSERLIERLYKWMRIGNESTEYLLPLDEYLKSTKADSTTMNFFTLNYDLVFEKHFNKNDETLLNTGFMGGRYTGFDERGTEKTYRINYYKLHGSINWEKDEAGFIRESFFYSDKAGEINQRQDKDSLVNVAIDDFLNNAPNSPHLIFGQGGKFLSVDPFISLIYKFKEQLANQDLIFVIGYSFFDPYINNMILEGLSKESINSKLLIVVNPQFDERLLVEDERRHFTEEEKSEKIKGRFVDFLKRVQLSAYLSDMPGFNLTEVAPNKIKILPIKMSQFVKDYFSNDGDGFTELQKELTERRGEGDIF